LVDQCQDVGPLDRMSIVFYPLGINHFIETPLSEFVEKHYSFFNYFNSDFNTFLDVVYAEPDLENNRNLLDDFFIKQYKPFKEPELLKTVDILLNSEQTTKVGSLANTMSLSRRTLLRKFKKHFGYTIEAYIVVIKFRKSLLIFQKNQAANQLSKIALESNYYDQADFNHKI